MSAAGAPVVASGVGAGYARGRPVIKGLDFTVPAGSSLAILGPNGGGKTTLFRALLGELPEVSGRLEVQRPVAYVPQGERSRLDFPLRALDVALMGTYASVPWYRPIGRREREVAREALARVGMEAEARTSWGALSGGQRQRVLIARALAQRAGVILLDEPLSGVDRPSAERIEALLGELRDEGAAVLVSTHDVELAAGYDRVLCLNREQVAFGEPASVMTAPTLERLYGAEIVVLPSGETARVSGHAAHRH
ncbi:metal ABC transporter ATP-binding protein [Thermoleophilia bacterium SCSIO 60948]|nr:metal ABC transporter ATP-binding protein [Thermoleophilia bacterium SCSIO 60948]